MMNGPPNFWKRMDRIGTVAACFVLLCGSLFAWFGVQMEDSTRVTYAAFVHEQIPWYSHTVAHIEKFYAIELLTLVILMLGIWLLVVVKDRLRANLYACLAGVAMGAIGLVCLGSRVLPIVRAVQIMTEERAHSR